MSLANPNHRIAPGRYIAEDEHPFWMHAFAADTRTEQLAEDRHAWTAVAGTLLTIVSVGVSLAAVSVVLCL